MPGQYIQQTWRSDPGIYAPARYKRACRYDAFVPDLLESVPVSLDGGVAGLVSEAEHAIRGLNQMPNAALTPLARLLLRTESIASSRVEGIQVGARQLARAEARAESGGRASATAVEVLSNIEAMMVALDEADAGERFDVGALTAIHARLMAGHPRIAGRIRDRQNWIGGNDHNPCGADFVPPPPERISALLADLCDAVNDDRLPPVVQAALVHAQFETIHPFEDGNGRTGRALIHVVLRRRRIASTYVPPISVIMAGAKDRYIEGLTGFRGSEVTRWIEYFAGAAARAAHLAAAYVRAVHALQARWRERVASLPSAPRAGAAVWALIDLLPAHPILTAPTAVSETGRAKAGIYPAIAQLEKAGVLSPLSSSRRNRSWEAVGLLDLIGGLEEGELPT